jgi:hypothetical protein
MIIEGQVGPRTVQDGGSTELRQSRLGALVTQHAHSKYYEAVSRGKVFTISTAVAGTTVAAANAAPPAAAAATVLSLYNPIGSGVNAVVMRGLLGSVSGTPGIGAFQWCVSWGNRVTATANATTRCNLIGGSSPVCQGFTQTALTGGLVHVNLRPLGVATFAGAIAATTPGLVGIDPVDGDIIVPPGGILTIADAATGTSHVVYGSISWEEVPV